MRFPFFIFIIPLFITSCVGKISQHTNQSQAQDYTNISPQTIDKKPDTITITAVGDIMLGSNYPSPRDLPGTNILKKITPTLQEGSDIILGNLEGTLFDKGGTPKQCNNPNLCFVFRTPSSYGKYLKEAGFDFLSIANNHSGDFGLTGRRETQKNLDSLGIQYAGLLNQNEYTIKEKNGIKYAFIGAGHNPGMIDIRKNSDIKRIIREIRPNADIIIVMFHGGAEGANYQHIPYKTEMYAGENRGNVKKFAHICIDSGADIVFGSGPHVTRAVELYKDKFIAYSLGNFATYGNLVLKGPNGKAPILKIKLDSKGNFLSGEVISTLQIEDTGLGPEIDSNNKAFKYMRTLTLEDFPNGLLEFHNNGQITRKKN